MVRTLCTGAAGFIGHWLVRHLKERGYWVCETDVAVEWPYGPGPADQWCAEDLRWPETSGWVANKTHIYALAADMGGIGYITDPAARLDILTNNVRINLNTLEAASLSTVDRLLFTSSVCVYPIQELTSPCPQLLTEEQAIPANPQDSYGWEKLFSEKLYELYRDTGLETRIVRLENTYGPECAWEGGKEKAPAALCRKVAMAKLKGEDHIDIWGDGEQRRTFMYIDDCVRGLVAVMESDCQEPVNLGPDESVSIDELADVIMEVAGVDFEKRYIEGPQGVRGRNFSHEWAKALGWEARVSLREGIAEMYDWIEGEIVRAL